MLIMGAVLFMGALALVMTARAAPNLPTALGAAGSSVSAHLSANSEHKVQKDMSGNVLSKIITAQIVTCPQCRLNALPKVKTFVHRDAPAFAPALKVKYVYGRDPHLFIYVNGRQTEDIDLAPLDSESIMKKLVSHGVHPSRLTSTVTAALGPNPTLQTSTTRSVVTATDAVARA
eukprot:IDg11202t1